MKKILLADDDAAIRQTLGQVLTLEQYDVVFAATVVRPPRSSLRTCRTWFCWT